MVSNLTIAQALRLVKKLKGKLAELSSRASASVSYVKDKEPAFRFEATRGELKLVREKLIQVEAAVAVANATTTIDQNGVIMTLAEAIRNLQELKADMAWLQKLNLRSGKEVTHERDYHPETGRLITDKVETEYISDLTEVERAKELDELQDRFDKLNDLVETANHRTPVDWSDPKE